MAAPTLLVGLGGTGSKIVKQVRLLAKSHHMENNLSYVVFDTDVNELAAIREDTPEIEVVQTSTKQTVGEYLDKDTYARDNWFPVNKILNRKTLSEGAGQVRAISRLALNTAIKAGKMTPLHRAIERLYKLNGEATMQAMRVILVGSLCGGTGSGLILPVSMYIRNYLITRFQQNAAIMRGFFLLPEVFLSLIHILRCCPPAGPRRWPTCLSGAVRPPLTSRPCGGFTGSTAPACSPATVPSPGAAASCCRWSGPTLCPRRSCGATGSSGTRWWPTPGP